MPSIKNENDFLARLRFKRNRAKSTDTLDFNTIGLTKNSVPVATEEELPKYMILYQGGTEDNSGILTTNQRIVIDNPFKIMNCLVHVELYLNEIWASPPLVSVYSDNTGRGVSAGCYGDSQLVIRSGSDSLTDRAPGHDGNLWETTAHINEASYRLRVLK